MKRGKVSIDRERCKGCSLCVRACPFKVLEIDSKMDPSGVYPAVFQSSRKMHGVHVLLPDVPGFGDHGV